MNDEPVICRGEEQKSVQVDEAMTMTAFLDRNVSPSASLVVTRLNGEHTRRVNHRSDKLFYILRGRGRFHVGPTTADVGRGDAVLIPHDVPHSFEGDDLEAVLVVAPGFDPDDEEIAPGG